jgi:hypothetical protein
VPASVAARRIGLDRDLGQDHAEPVRLGLQHVSVAPVGGGFDWERIRREEVDAERDAGAAYGCDLL